MMFIVFESWAAPFAILHCLVFKVLMQLSVYQNVTTYFCFEEFWLKNILKTFVRAIAYRDGIFFAGRSVGQFGSIFA